jgi:hypothetical protein
VRFLSRTTHVPQLLAPNDELPIHIAAGALGELRPARDLYVSPGHSIFIDGHLVIARLLVNGTTITRTTVEHWKQLNIQQIKYFNLELERHQLIIAEDLLVESFVDNVPRRLWDNYADYLSLYQEELPIAELPFPHIRFSHEIPPILSYLKERNESSQPLYYPCLK